ncbi:MAG: M48 family metalloprotease, partial [Betaproteobacteria bacterium]|nr:M48 family metalloprotease [Betaproteobacteria bacterium]
MTMRNIRRFITAGLALLLLATAPVGFSQTNAKKPKESASARKAHEQILKAYGVYEDQALQDYVSEVGQRVAKMSELADAEWKFVVIDDDSINAFTTGCCYVYVARGLLTHLNSEAE